VVNEMCYYLHSSPRRNRAVIDLYHCRNSDGDGLMGKLVPEVMNVFHFFLEERESPSSFHFFFYLVYEIK
jgi:hypothetical protein